MYPNNHTKTLLLASVLMMGSGGFVSCVTDSKYDLDDLDKTIGLGGGELNVPTSSTNVIKLSDILELNDGDCVSEDSQTHNYMFRQESHAVSPTKVSIDKITLASPKINRFGLEITMPQKPDNLDASNPLLSTLPPYELKIEESKEIQTFAFTKSLPDDVKDLKEVAISPNEVKLDVHFSNISSILGKIDEVVLELPEFMTISEVKGANSTRSGNKFTLQNVPTTDLNLTIVITGVKFDDQNSSSKNLWIDSNRNIQMKGNVKMSIKVNAQIELTNQALWENFGKKLTIDSDLSMNDFVINEAKGYFNPTINLNELGSTSIDNVPNFLREDGTCIDLYNPQIYIRLGNTMDVGGDIEGKLYAYKDGKQLENTPVEVKGIKIEPNTTSVVCVCRDKTAQPTGECTQIVEVPNLSNIIRTIPDRIEFADIKATGDDSRLTTVQLGHNYEITPEYWVEAPISFAEDAVIIYTDSFDGLNDDLEDIDLTSETKVELTATVENKLPAYCEMELIPVDAKGNDISDSNAQTGKIRVSKIPEIAASKDGVSAATTQINVTVEQARENALRDLDGFKVRLHIKAKGNDGNVVKGITLNGEQQTLSLKNISIKIKGGVIVDLN